MNSEQGVQIRIGYELVYECPQATPMLLMLNVHSSRASDLLVPDTMVTDPPIPISSYRDGFGNRCSRIVAPIGRLRLSANGIVNDTGKPNAGVSEAHQNAVQDLPDEALVFLVPSRYCETDRLSDMAWSLFENAPSGWGVFRQSVITCISISPSATNTPAQPGRLGKLTAIAPECAGILLTLPSPSAVA